MELHATKRVLGGLLKQDSFAIQDGESLFQARNLVLAALLALGVRLGLSNAALLNALVVLVHSIQLGLHTRAVGIRLRSGFVEALCFLGLVLHVLVLGSCCDLILLGCSLVLTDGSLLGCVHLCKSLCEIRFADFEKADDS